jgi:hypothetical protein
MFDKYAVEIGAWAADEHASVGHEHRGVVVRALARGGGHRCPRLRVRVVQLGLLDRAAQARGVDFVDVGARERHHLPGG